MCCACVCSGHHTPLFLLHNSFLVGCVQRNLFRNFSLWLHRRAVDLVAFWPSMLTKRHTQQPLPASSRTVDHSYPSPHGKLPSYRDSATDDPSLSVGSKSVLLSWLVLPPARFLALRLCMPPQHASMAGGYIIISAMHALRVSLSTCLFGYVHSTVCDAHETVHKHQMPTLDGREL